MTALLDELAGMAAEATGAPTQGSLWFLPLVKAPSSLRKNEQGVESSVELSPGGISVHYSLIFEVTSPEISSEEAEGTTESPEDSVMADLREMVTKALREEASLPIDLTSLNFQPEVIHLPALSATSTIEVVNEPDSHNEFEVSTVEPEVNKPRLEVPLTPMEKENALVTLLDPTALPDDETTAVTGGMAERNDNSPASQDITEEEEAIYVGEPELSNEGLPIITHEIETIHHDEIGELVRDYIPISPVILELETDAPFINLSPNLISEEDLSPVEEEGEDLDVVTPTSQVLFTTAAFAEEVTITTLSGITGQPPTEAMVNVEENEDVNALPGEEEAGLAVPETEDVSELEVEILEPEEEVAEVSEPEEEVAEVSEPEEEVVEVSEPEEEVVEVSEPEEEVAEVSEPEEEVVEVSEPEEAVENQEEVAGSEPEESEPEAETETSDGAVEILNEEHVEEEVEVMQPEKEIVELEGEGNEEPEEGISEVLNAVESEETEPEVPDETEPEVPEETEPEVPDETEPEVTEETEPEVQDETEPEVTEETEPEVTEETEPEVPDETEPEVPEETEPEVTEETEPEVTEETEPEVPDETEPEVEVAEEEAVDVVKPVEEEEVPEVPEPEEEVVEISEVEEEEVVEPTTPAEVVVEVLEPAPEPEHEPEDNIVEEAESEEPEPSEELAEVVEEDPETGKESEEVTQPEEEVVEDEQPAEVGPEPQEEVVVPPAEELPEVSEPASEEAVPEPNPEEEMIELLEPEPEEDVTEPAAESIQILQPFDSVEDLNVGEDTVEIIEDNEFLPPIRLDQHLPHEEDNLPIVPADIQPPEEDEPVIQEDVDTSDIAEVTDQDNNDTSEGTEEDSISPESDASVTETPVSDSFPSPPATEVSEPNPTSDSGLFEGTEPEPAVVIIDENLNPSVPKGIEIQTLPPATDDIIDEAVQDLAVELDQSDISTNEISESEESETGLLPEEGEWLSCLVVGQTSAPSTARPPVKYLTTPP
ncbi:titin [Notothenia coriiceps]|uniref:Titin n=1 Tax=Notothenia coriiceps TaxID=8208 RepID=A0A6I9Q1X9_9TELE|nr:PREDICTED: sterile alpha motif domain-containing protein 15 [Notothenia coriiceps]